MNRIKGQRYISGEVSVKDTRLCGCLMDIFNKGEGFIKIGDYEGRCIVEEIEYILFPSFSFSPTLKFVIRCLD